MASNSQQISVRLAPEQTRKNFEIMGTQMLEMLQKKGKEEPKQEAMSCVKSARDELKTSLLALDHGSNWITSEPQVISAQYYVEQMMKSMWRICCKYS